jgi:hypothetical protein
MKKKIIKIFLWAALCFVLIITLFASVLYLNKEKVQSIIINEINASLSTPIEVGKIDISLKKFPSASLLLKNIYTRGINTEEGDTLLFAEEVFFQFDIWQAITSDISIKKISIENAILDLKYFKNGNNNFQIWKSDNNSENQIFTLQEISLIHVNIRFYHETSSFNTSVFTSSSTLNGDFNAQSIRINSRCNFDVNYLSFSDKRTLKNFNTRFRLSLTQKDDISYFESSSATVAGLDFTFTGEASSSKSLFSAKSEELSLAKLQQFLEKQMIWVPQDFTLDGKAAIDLSWGSLESEEPGLLANFRVRDGEFSSTERLALSSITCNGSYYMDQSSDETIIKNFQSKSKTGTLNGSASIKNLSKPLFKLNLTSNINLSEWADILQLDTLENTDGKLDLELDFKNQFQSFENISKADLRNAHLKGSLKIEDGSFSFKESTNSIKSMNGELRFSDSKAIINRLFFETGRSDMYLEGRFLNVLPFVLLENQKLDIDCRVKSQNLKIDDFLTGGDSNPDSYNLDFTQSVNLDVLMEIEKFAMQSFRASEIKTRLQIKNQKIKVTDLEMNSDEGHYKGSLTILTSDVEPYALSAKLSFQKLNINRLFKSFENFGQEAIVAKNIYGTLSGSGSLQAQMSPALIIDEKSIHLESDIEINKGGIKDYEPMLALSRFSDIEELKNVQFNSLKNHISIQNSVLSIPKMQVNSSVLDLEIKGTHNFENVVDYRFKLKAEDALFKKRKKKQKPSEFDEHLVQRSKDEPYIYVKMYGNIDALKIELDQQSIGQSITKDLKDQGKQLKDIFKKDKPDKKSDNPGIIYDWEEEDDGSP